MGRYKYSLAALALLALACLVQSQYFRPLYRGPPLESRRGLPQSNESTESDEDESEERTRGRVKLPPGFDAAVRRKMRVNGRPARPLHGDPSPIHQDEEVEGRKPESRLLWPFSIEITKGGEKGGWGPGPAHYGSYSGPPQAHHAHHSYGDENYDPDDDPEVQKLRIEMFKMVARTKKWKKILKYNLAEVGAAIVTKGIEFLEFI